MTKLGHFAWALACAAAGLSPLAASAQETGAAEDTETAVDAVPAEIIDAFGGEWFSFDAAFGSAEGPCAVTLADTPAEGALSVQTSGCAEPIASAEAWRVAGGQIRLLDGPRGAEIAALGGNQFRVTGELSQSGRPLILERAAGDGNAGRINAAVSEYRCVFYGFTDRCVQSADLELPAFEEGGSAPQIETLVNLQVRSQPRSDAPTVGVIPREATITVDACLVASDGLWCRASFGSDTGWFARFGLRDDTGPVLTFTVASAEE